ncbi:MAG: hypothetical protein DCC66_13005 [Planctomycetota bacterium]|nr:MAG: hypothetical protein DCC66_13005 [Planctomycetota bacterium]
MAAVLAAALIATPAAVHAVICIVPDVGGTAQLPPQCVAGYLSPQQVHMIVNGLPPGTTIIADFTHREFGITNSGPGGGLGGEFEQFNSFAGINLQGTGALAGFNRFVGMQLQCETHIGPRTLGAPVQSFPTDFFMMQGQLPPGDPDFDLLRITAGTAFGMPSPGHTTLTQRPGGTWNVDSFFDITYRIDFIGAPGGALAGMSGSTTGTVRMQAGDPVTPGFCRCKGDFNLDAVVDLLDVDSFVDEVLKVEDADLCADMNNSLNVDGQDIRSFLAAIFNGGNCPALDAWETPDSTGLPTSSSFYTFGGPGQPSIPAGFFHPGSLPFDGMVLFDSQPIDPINLGPTDTIVKRPGLPGPPGPGLIVPIEMLELNLVSAAPITVDNGTFTEQWHVNVAISDTPAPGGNMIVQQTGPNGGTFSAVVNVRPVFVFTNAQDLEQLDAGLITPDEVRVRVLDTGDPGSPLNPLQLQFGDGPTSSDWASQVCGQPLEDGLFMFHNPGFPFVPGINAPFNCFDAFKPGPMKHVKPGEAHYIKPPNRNPGGVPIPRCGYHFIGSKVFCRSGKVGKCPPAPPVLCGRRCPPLPCPTFGIRIVRIGCKAPSGLFNRGFCVQFYRLRPPPFDCAVCP